MQIIGVTGLALLCCGVLSVPTYWWLIHRFSPARYARLKAQGRFPGLPETWDDLWSQWARTPSDFEVQMLRLSQTEDPRIFYGRFVDQHLMPIPYFRAVGTWAGICGIALLGLYGIGKLLGW
jgi:hypothetical protein